MTAARPAGDAEAWRAGWYQIGDPPRFVGNTPGPFTAEAGGQQITTWVTVPCNPEDIP
jgi:hypothetical protein